MTTGRLSPRESSGDGASPGPVASVFVVVPAHDEVEAIGACLRSLAVATATLALRRPDLPVTTILVLDRCQDGTQAVARELGVEGLVVSAGGVGAARAAGLDHVVAAVADLDPDLDPDLVLVVNTDADCVVPADWLLDHVELSRHHDLVQGEVVPDPALLSARALALWRRRNPAGRGSLHGANLAFRLGAYLRAGGFPDVVVQEDLLLVRAMKANGVRATGGTVVTTSSRRHGRVAAGFAGYLRGLDDELDDESAAELADGSGGVSAAGRG